MRLFKCLIRDRKVLLTLLVGLLASDPGAEAQLSSQDEAVVQTVLQSSLQCASQFLASTASGLPTSEAGWLSVLRASPCFNVTLLAQILAPGASATDAGTGNGLGSRNMLIVMLLVIGGLLVTMVAGGVLLYYWAQRQAKPTKLMKPPGVGPQTTLLVTDIQNSTQLWEQIPSAIMDKAIKQHHDCMRAALERVGGGWEASTEGDSFILAFSHPELALRFCLDAQLLLLAADWPPEVLDHPDGRLVVVASNQGKRRVEEDTSVRGGNAAASATGSRPLVRPASSQRLGNFGFSRFTRSSQPELPARSGSASLLPSNDGRGDTSNSGGLFMRSTRSGVPPPRLHSGIPGISQKQLPLPMVQDSALPDAASTRAVASPALQDVATGDGGIRARGTLVGRDSSDVEGDPGSARPRLWCAYCMTPFLCGGSCVRGSDPRLGMEVADRSERSFSRPLPQAQQRPAMRKSGRGSQESDVDREARVGSQVMADQDGRGQAAVFASQSSKDSTTTGVTAAGADQTRLRATSQQEQQFPANSSTSAGDNASGAGQQPQSLLAILTGDQPQLLQGAQQPQSAQPSGPSGVSPSSSFSTALTSDTLGPPTSYSGYSAPYIPGGQARDSRASRPSPGSRSNSGLSIPGWSLDSGSRDRYSNTSRYSGASRPSNQSSRHSTRYSPSTVAPFAGPIPEMPSQSGSIEGVPPASPFAMQQQVSSPFANLCPAQPADPPIVPTASGSGGTFSRIPPARISTASGSALSYDGAGGPNISLSGSQQPGPDPSNSNTSIFELPAAVRPTGTAQGGTANDPWEGSLGDTWTTMTRRLFPLVPASEVADVGTSLYLNRQARDVRRSPEPLILYRGLRVRMGMHAGVSSKDDVVFNATASRQQFKGVALTAARLIGQCAPGGLIMLSKPTYLKLNTQTFDGLCMLVYAGRHELEAGNSLGLQAALSGHSTESQLMLPDSVNISPPRRNRFFQRSAKFNDGGALTSALPPEAMPAVATGAAPQFTRVSLVLEAPGQGGTASDVFLAVPSGLYPRLAWTSGEMRSVKQHLIGSPQAPACVAVVAYMYVEKGNELVQRYPGPSRRALKVYRSIVLRNLAATGGYLVETTADGLSLACFGEPGAAVAWAIQCMQDVQQQEWPVEFTSPGAGASLTTNDSELSVTPTHASTLGTLVLNSGCEFLGTAASLPSPHSKLLPTPTGSSVSVQAPPPPPPPQVLLQLPPLDRSTVPVAAAAGLDLEADDEERPTPSVMRPSLPRRNSSLPTLPLLQPTVPPATAAIVEEDIELHVDRSSASVPSMRVLPTQTSLPQLRVRGQLSGEISFRRNVQNPGLRTSQSLMAPLQSAFVVMQDFHQPTDGSSGSMGGRSIDQAHHESGDMRALAASFTDRSNRSTRSRSAAGAAEKSLEGMAMAAGPDSGPSSSEVLTPRKFGAALSFGREARHMQRLQEQQEQLQASRNMGTFTPLRSLRSAATSLGSAAQPSPLSRAVPAATDAARAMPDAVATAVVAVPPPATSLPPPGLAAVPETALFDPLRASDSSRGQTSEGDSRPPSSPLPSLTPPASPSRLAPFTAFDLPTSRYASEPIPEIQRSPTSASANPSGSGVSDLSIFTSAPQQPLKASSARMNPDHIPVEAMPLRSATTQLPTGGSGGQAEPASPSKRSVWGSVLNRAMIAPWQMVEKLTPGPQPSSPRAAAVAAAATTSDGAPTIVQGGGAPHSGGFGVISGSGGGGDVRRLGGQHRSSPPRGLVLKVGMDWGKVTNEINHSTGRCTYRGRVMNRAARVAALAHGGQILVSDNVWKLAKSTSQHQTMARISASAIGPRTLRGVTEPVMLWSCTLEGDA